MIGTFTTLKFEDRAAFERGYAYEQRVSHNRYTDAGLRWMWEMMSGQIVDDSLVSARIVIGNSELPFSGSDASMLGDQTDAAELDEGFPGIQVQVLEDETRGILTLKATFGEDQGVFDWRERGVVTSKGVLLDRAVGDQGRKVLGAIWQTQAQLELRS